MDNIASLLEELERQVDMVEKDQMEIKEDFSMISLKLDEISEEQERIRECIKIESKACEEDTLFFKNLRSEADEIAADLKDLKKQANLTLN
jgi:hypothetical protein